MAHSKQQDELLGEGEDEDEERDQTQDPNAGYRFVPTGPRKGSGSGVFH